VTVQGVGPMLLLYAIDTGEGPLPFLPCAHLPASGTYDVLAMPVGAWISLYAVHADPSDDTVKQSPPSNVVRVRASALPAFRLTVSKREQTEVVLGRTNAFGLTVQLVEGLGLSTKAFLYRRENFGTTPGYRDVFLGVCKPGDLAYPEDEPNVTTSPLFRSDVVSMLDRSPVAISEDWFTLLHDLDELVYTMNLWQEAQLPA
jgi:hypothetical protein